MDTKDLVKILYYYYYCIPLKFNVKQTSYLEQHFGTCLNNDYIFVNNLFNQCGIPLSHVNIL